ncbi:MAG TPA: DUF2273 domain-containing protein [Candidatus Faecaligallichristensenella faecipullorum]|nr:DUF2273 domain-containing protein [Candidatus Faecaligallichristensenella faecipullorum]
MPKEYIKQIIGALVGLIVGILFLTIGFWKTLLLVALSAAGWWLMGERKFPHWLIALLNRIQIPGNRE